jgi:UDP:flavonoid glycosyltransferase YjiC (YdhE family)
MICHGGAGVVNACLRAGVPSVVIPVLGDQTAWGMLLQAKGLGLLIKRSPPSDLTSDDIIDAVRTVLGEEGSSDETMIQKRCRQLGETIRKQRDVGPQKLVEIIDNYFDGSEEQNMK